MRARLTELLDGAPETALTMIVAPAGLGKTSLVAGWVAARHAADTDFDAQWVPVREHEILIAGILSGAGVPQSAVARVVLERDEASAHADAIELLRETDALETPRVVIVDDAHQLPPSSVRFLARAIALVPERLRLVLLTRRDLALPLIPLELSGQLTVIRAGQLRFRDDEARELVSSHAPAATDDDVHQLQERTQGWAAALILGARAVDAADDKSTMHMLLRMTDLPVLDYLLSESLDGLAAQTRQLLLATCDEDEVTVEAAIALSGLEDAPVRLAGLARDGLLVTAYPDARHGIVWQYHPLLIELLRRRATSWATDDGTASAAHVRGVRYARAVGDDPGAIRHAILSEDPDLLALELLELGPDLLVSGDGAALERGLTHLSPRSTGFPELLGVAALSRRALGDVGGALQLTIEASTRQAARRSTSHVGALLEADLVLLDLWRARFGWFDHEAAVTRARATLGEAGGDPGGDGIVRELPLTRVCLVRLELAAVEAWSGELHAASTHVEAALLDASSLGADQLTIAALSLRALVDVCIGEVQSAVLAADRCLELAELNGIDEDTSTVRARLARAWAAFHMLDSEVAARELDRVRAASVSVLDPMVSLMASVLRAHLLADAGRPEEAERALPAAAPAPAIRSRFGLQMVAATRARLAIDAGEEIPVATYVAQLRELGYDVLARAFEALGTAAAGRAKEAIALLDPNLGAQDADLVERAWTAVLRLALLLEHGRTQDAREALPHVLTTVASQRLLRVLAEAAGADGRFVELLYDEVQRPAAHPFAAEALAAVSRYRRPVRAHERAPVPSPPADVDVPTPRETGTPAVQPIAADTREPLVVPLTPRETEVLLQLSLGGSYGDIARALLVTENTVKSHVGSIYRKLGVERRADALRTARELGLIHTPTAGPDRAADR
ncbi:MULTISPECIES: helix-turn-helix transcriptional regulator [unclassified Nocardioides]|uniref:helix-turn-helix transcriptional regulator n=1 Tax=unclassified Nocardioides TaxID=2615069 RepID=UPI0036071848